LKSINSIGIMVNKEILMKNNIYGAGRGFALTLLALACVFFIAGCGDEDESNHTDASFLVGTWSNPGIAKFTIKADYTFVCDLVDLNQGADPDDIKPARVRGTLTFTASGLGPNDYLMQSMVAAGSADPDASYNEGNEMLSGMLGPFQGLLATFTPSADNRQFIFSTINQTAQMFFGGTYTKQ
jgi:hypothetical protein